MIEKEEPHEMPPTYPRYPKGCDDRTKREIDQWFNEILTIARSAAKECRIPDDVKVILAHHAADKLVDERTKIRKDGVLK